MSDQYKIVLTGGGSGGHITPIQAIAGELKRLKPSVNIIYIGQIGDKLGDIPANDQHIDAVYSVRAGKFRRYHGEGFKQIFDLATLFKNMRDALFVVIGIVQSFRLLRQLRPNVIFVKGGFVGVPVGLAAVMLNIPYITHDSDAIPGLANRIISRWAKLHAVALPAEVYPYPQSKTVTTGIPLQPQFQPVDDKLNKLYRQQLNIPLTAKVLFIIGGGLGSQRINEAVAEAVPHLINEFKDLYVIHGVGRANEDYMKQLYADKLTTKEQTRLSIFGYKTDVFRYSGAADLIIMRAGATNIAEFAVQAKACIIIPSPFLTGGHQLKNAKILADKQAAVIMNEVNVEADPNRLAKQVSNLLNDGAGRQSLARNLSTFAKPNATHDLAEIILKTAN